MNYPYFPIQTIGYKVLHAVESGHISKVLIERYLRHIGVVVYPRQISDALQRLKRQSILEHHNGQRDRWRLVK